ncbi:ABC transporter ATP-binding protein [Sphaerochaeta halotolerans]|jgi:iron(III) transport system ATP-binding protein|uniref:ABC transporter ATP-binding protein n=1 Tax=Sphaerochaeta halotolerans TaxID=2293840 RepID=UPI001371F113|nr:ABC transporter ATP-binding protein [Sphaerochaeta halotolerans]MBG0768266.1 ABC transporter ATP-binding protein [Spirochaetaceae bacterium]MDK2860663.1 iron(III) transport system ATP-binding protein [Sphaerochaeta sp.]MXI87255.1 ATP-binding cassette domain-containing protein [Sphaerochaeta halotolerans]
MEKKSVSVTLEHVTKRFKDVKGKSDVIAVNDSHFVIEPGELVTLLGPSGCGKTTTLRMIAGFELPTEGKIYIGNEEVTMLPPNKRDTATMFQSYGLFPHMTVFDNVAYGLKLRKIPHEDIVKRVNETLALVGLSDYGDRAPSKLSGGQQQRVALARSLIVTPSVLLLDEPLSNLDALLREQMRVEIRKIQKELGITAVYVTHDRVEAMSLSDRVVVMKDGFIRQIGSPIDIYENPNSRFVAGFVGKAAFFPVRVKKQEANLWTCELGEKEVVVERATTDVEVGTEAVLMARPESLRVTEKGKGKIEGKVRMNVYLGNSMEAFINTSFGEVLVQIDDPHAKKVFEEGEEVSIDFTPDRVRLLNENEA